MFSRFGELSYGYTSMAEMNGKHANMLMDVGVYKFKAGEAYTALDTAKESAFLLLDGEVEILWEGQSQVMKRVSVFDENPWCLHVPKAVSVEIKASSDAEVLIQKTTNDQEFASKLYTPEDCTTDVFGDGVWDDVARRAVRTVFDYSSAPYSNMVMGEVINYPGKWSSYIPHGHDQPEIYYYRFNKPQGFGACFIGDEAFKITHNSMAAIPGGPTHPQTSAPGYAMYYCWMIRHLENNPWNSRDNDPAHEWLLEENVKIWPNK